MGSSINRALICAEIGENHCGDWELADHMLESAAKSGADIVKFQLYNATDISDSDPEKEWFTKVAVPDQVYIDLVRRGHEFGVEVMASAFTIERAKFVIERLGQQSIKIASSELTNTPLFSYIGQSSVEQVYLSTGMGTFKEITDAIQYLKAIPKVCLMHCTSVYPCPPREANLTNIYKLVEAIPPNTEDWSIGYSDHTIGLVAPVAARALGATVIEKHFTTDRSLPGSDQILSAMPDELERMIARIRWTEEMLGDPAANIRDKQPTDGEKRTLNLARGRFTKLSSQPQ